LQLQLQWQEQPMGQANTFYKWIKQSIGGNSSGNWQRCWKTAQQALAVTTIASNHLSQMEANLSC